MAQKILTLSAGGILTEVNDAYQGTVTSVAALTLGTTGTDLSSTVATGTTTPVITLQVPTASAANRGALSSTDWSTFNGKQPALGYTPVNKAGDTGVGDLSMGALSASTGTFTGAVVSTGFQTGKNNVSATTGTAYTMFTMSGLCRWEVFATLGWSGNPAAFGAFATVIFDGIVGRIVASNGTNMVISLSGADVQATQSAGSTNTIYYSWVCLPA